MSREAAFLCAPRSIPPGHRRQLAAVAAGLSASGGRRQPRPAVRPFAQGLDLFRHGGGEGYGVSQHRVHRGVIRFLPGGEPGVEGFRERLFDLGAGHAVRRLGEGLEVVGSWGPPVLAHLDGPDGLAFGLPRQVDEERDSHEECKTFEIPRRCML